MASSKRISQNTSTSDDNRASKRRQANNPEEPQHPPNRYLPFLTPNDIASHMVPVIRKMLQEELDRRLTQGVGLILNQPAASNRRRLQLCFNNKLPSTIFTQTIIKAEGEKPLQIELRDQQGVVTNESSSSMKIRMCVLDGDFGSNGEEDWTPKEFKDQTVIPREGREPLLIGDTVIKLENGVGYINNKIVFTDICRTRSRTFRLGLQVVDPNIIEAAEIKEGRSEPFRVLDHRGEAYKKHERPSLNDEVWRLRGIHKHGKIHEQLLLHGINTVEDFLQLYTTNQGSLQEKIGKTAGKYWKTIITHAKDCDVYDDDKRYIYFATDSPISLVFNCVYEILEVTFDGQNYRSIPSLSSKETRLVERVKQRAYSNLKDLKPFDTTTHSLRKTLTGGVQEDEQYGGPGQVPQQFDIPIPEAQQGQRERLPSFSALEELLPYYYSAGEQVISGAHFGDGEPFPSYLFSPNQWEQVIASPFSSGAECSNHSSFPHKTTVWPKIRIAFKCVMIHVARKKAQVIYQQ